MSIHSSLKSSSSLERHRNVLSRAERLKILKEQEKWDEGKSVFGLQKVAHRKVAVGGKDKKAKEGEAVAGAEGAPAAAAAPAAGAAAAAKPAAKAVAKPAAKPAGKAK